MKSKVGRTPNVEAVNSIAQKAASQIDKHKAKAKQLKRETCSDATRELRDSLSKFKQKNSQNVNETKIRNLRTTLASIRNDLRDVGCEDVDDMYDL